MPEPTVVERVPPVRRRRYQRGQRLRGLGYSSYAEYLRSPQWQAVKARYRASDLPQECICGEADGLDLHHKTYERVGQEPLADLVPLCRRCHAMIHALERRGEIALNFDGLLNAVRAQAGQALLRADDARRDREQQEMAHDLRASLDALPFGKRLRFVTSTARARRIDVSRQLLVLRSLFANGRSRHKLERHLACIESRVFARELGGRAPKAENGTDAPGWLVARR